MKSTPAPSSQTSYKPVTESISKGNKGALVFVAIFVFLAFISLMGYGFYSFLRSVGSSIDNTSETSENTIYTTEFKDEIPSSCGYTLGRPNTILQTPDYKEWVYEERYVQADGFRNLAPKEALSQGVLLTAMSFKGVEDSWTVSDEKKTSYKYNFPGLVSYCVNNTSKWSLDDFIANVEKSSNDDLSYVIGSEKEMWGDIEVQNINVTGILNGSYVNEPFFIGITSADSEFSRLVIFQPWGANEDRIEVDRKALPVSLKNRTMSSALSSKSVSTSSTQVVTVPKSAPTCTQFKIYEGDFKSDKCYNSQDLQDLQYYIQRYNSAIFDINAAASGSKITCNGSDFFKDACNEDKKQYEKGKKDKEEYESKVKELIAKGK